MPSKPLFERKTSEELIAMDNAYCNIDVKHGYDILSKIISVLYDILIIASVLILMLFVTT